MVRGRDEWDRGADGKIKLPIDDDVPKFFWWIVTVAFVFIIFNFGGC